MVLSFPKIGVFFPIMENQMEKKMENEMETELYRGYMVVSQNRGTPIWTQIYYSPYLWDPQNGTPNSGKPLNVGFGIRALGGMLNHSLEPFKPLHQICHSLNSLKGDYIGEIYRGLL